MNNQQAKNFFAFVGAATVALAMFGAGAILAGCDSNKNIVPPIPSTSYYTEANGWVYCVKVIDGCQYIVVGHGMAHKGNCTNSIHIYRAENGK